VLASNTKQTTIQYNKTNNTTTNKLLSTRNQGVCENYNKPTNLIFILLFYFIEDVSIAIVLPYPLFGIACNTGGDNS